MKLNPLSNRVVIKFVEAEEKTQGGILLTAAAQEKPQVAEVVAVGPGGLVDGKEVEMVVKVGDKVKKNQLIANAAEGLGVAIHSPMNGAVTAIGKKAIVILKEG